jgi:hypothetical protein
VHSRIASSGVPAWNCDKQRQVSSLSENGGSVTRTES